MSKKVLFNSELTNNIYIAEVMRSGLLKPNKQDVTIECLVATAKHCIKFGEPVVITDLEGNPEFEITVKTLGGES